ncbi:hypothetical protein SH668x_001734 [Planctomicrobium sp. SH668]|uniref:hypothetical protein n=1 Tax=Planctomicrobium sp. SH668 TaxID=3448126 RepID=UPI003F5B463E
MNAPTYPQRDSFFAHKFCRLMVKVCLANELGADACYLLMVIAHTEDAAHYRRATTWFNGQLMTVLGISQQKTLIRIRKTLIDAGWLHYEEGGKGKAGRYWVLIPQEAIGIDDQPSDEGDSMPVALSEIQRNGNQEDKSSTAHCHSNGKRSGSDRHNHSTLSQTPPLIPTPLEEGEKPPPPPTKEFQDVVDAWNNLPAPFPKCSKISGKRKAALKSRLSDRDWRESWPAALARLPISPFLRGENERGWVADVDFFLKTDSVTKILEGKYSSNGKASTSNVSNRTNSGFIHNPETARKSIGKRDF